MPRGIHGVRRVSAYQIDDAKGSLFMDLQEANRAARRAEFERRVKAWVERITTGTGIHKGPLVAAILSNEGAAMLNEAFKMYNGNAGGRGCQAGRQKRRYVRKSPNATAKPKATK
jgi:hypothetical protein